MVRCASFRRVVSVVVGLFPCWAWAAGPAAPTFQELMDPARFPEPQQGMVVEYARPVADGVAIRTTGSDILVEAKKGEICFDQRIGHPRPVAVLRIGQVLEGAEVTHTGPGLARIVFKSPAITVRINGDSLFMLHVRQPLTVSVDRRIEPAWNDSFQACHLIADEWGAFGLYCSQRQPDERFDAYADTVARYALAADAVLWVSVCPPKPYDWQRSLKDNVVWHWSNTLGYPPDDTLRSWKDHGNIVLLQSEVMLWKDWNLDFVPRLGDAEFARVRKTLHDANVRFIVYTSPYYFLKGTPIESKAMNSFENFKGFPPGWATGENMGLFLPAIRRVMSEYKPDGLYFDGQYIDNPAALYALARESRTIVGENGILEWHSTQALGPGRCYLPQADAYVDFILRGEGSGQSYADFDYLRFFVSGYNINNCIGVICNNGPETPSPRLAADVVRANARFHTIAGWINDAKLMKVLKNDYQARLTPELRQAVDQGVDERQKQVVRTAAERRAERQALDRPPAWDKPAFSPAFDAMPDAKRCVSPANPDALSAVDRRLHIRAHAHTYAFVRFPLKTPAGGMVVKIRQGSDGGQSWGPAAMIRWADGAGLRIGTRSDATLQADVLGNQLHGGRQDPQSWVWLRARWQRRTGVIEVSRDGNAFERLWTFEHGGAFVSPPTELLVGKVPYNGQTQDHTDPGEVGECDIEFVNLFAE